MRPLTFIFFGRSGSGKGTQAKLLIDYLRESDTTRKTIYIETGARFREFAEEASHTSKLTSEIMHGGGLLPAFLPIWIWTDYLIKNTSGNEHMVLDGLSRRISEAPILDSAMKFYKRQKPYVITINVSREWSKEKLLSRGRSDDNKKDIEERLNWYEENVLPTVDFFKNNQDYHFIEVNGEQSIEDVHNEMLEKIFGKGVVAVHKNNK